MVTPSVLASCFSIFVDTASSVRQKRHCWLIDFCSCHTRTITKEIIFSKLTFDVLNHIHDSVYGAHSFVKKLELAAGLVLTSCLPSGCINTVLILSY